MNSTDLSWIKRRCDYQYKNNNIIYTRNSNSIYFNEYDEMNLYYMEFVEKIINSYHVVCGKNVNDKIERVKSSFDSDEYNNIEVFYIKLIKEK